LKKIKISCKELKNRTFEMQPSVSAVSNLECYKENICMLSIPGVYENGQVRLLEPVPNLKRADVIVIIMEEKERIYIDIPPSEKWLFDNEKAFASVQRGLTDCG